LPRLNFKEARVAAARNFIFLPEVSPFDLTVIFGEKT
jgi:hypothetical protein